MAFRDWFGPTARPQVETVEARSLDVSDIAVAFAAAQEAAVYGHDSSLPAVYRAAQFIADTVASLPLHVVEQNTGLVDPTHTPDVLRSPNPAESYHDTMTQIVSSLIWAGNAYLWPRTRDVRGDITSLIVLDPDEVSVAWDRARLYRTYAWRDRTMQRDQDIIHIPMFLLPGQAEGRGPITAARETLTGAKAEQQLATTLAADYSAPRGVIEADARLTKDEADAILDGWEASHQGRGRLAVMGGGARFAPLGMKPIDMEFIEARKFSVQEVARLFGVPGIFLATDSGSSLTYATTESLFRMFVTSTLRPTYLERIEQAYSRLLPKGQIARFDTSELLGADMTARYAAYTQALDAGWMTPDEIRAREGLSPL